MGRLTEDMTRLVAEINAKRSERAGMIRDVKHGTGQMKRAVAEMLSSFHAAHSEMARTQRRSLRDFTSGLEHMVAGMRSAFASDLSGARAAFFGSAAAQRGHGRRSARAFTPAST